MYSINATYVLLSMTQCRWLRSETGFECPDVPLRITILWDIQHFKNFKYYPIENGELKNLGINILYRINDYNVVLNVEVYKGLAPQSSKACFLQTKNVS